MNNTLVTKYLTDEDKAKEAIQVMKTYNENRNDKDTRYNEPKEAHNISEDLINKTIDETEIYSKAKERILKAQRGQVGYGLKKYPEPLNASTWDIFETLDHLMDESIDRMHYFEMLRIKFKEMDQELEELRLYKEKSEGTALIEELLELRTYKKNIEKFHGGPIKISNGSGSPRLYVDEFVYPLTYIGGADHDGDIVYPKSDINHYKENDEEESTYIKNCKKATEVQQHITMENISAQDFVRLVNGVAKELKTGGM